MQRESFTGVGSRPGCHCPVGYHRGVLRGQLNWPSGPGLTPLHRNLSLYLIVKDERVYTHTQDGLWAPTLELVYLSQRSPSWWGCVWAAARWTWSRSPWPWEGCPRPERCPERRGTGRSPSPWKASGKGDDDGEMSKEDSDSNEVFKFLSTRFSDLQQRLSVNCHLTADVWLRQT